MAEQESDIIKPAKNQLKLAASVITDAFMNYPLVQYFFPDVEKRKKNLHVLWEMEVNYAFKYGRIYTTKGFEGVIYCIDTDISDFKTILCGSIKIPLILGTDFIKRQNEVTLVQNDLKKKYVKSKYIYLWAIGVLPQHQGKKIGSKLVRHILKQAKNEDKVVYLETAKEENIKIYERLGFKLMESYYFPDKDLYTHAMLWTPEK
jgi:ribosomal protein S18 acetylase RimI-like enzyme